MENPLMNLPPLDALRGFVAVARRMSITQAANDLCLTQSAVSRQIQALEEYLGTPVIVRKHRAIALTEAGERLMALSSPWMDRLSETTRSIRHHGRTRPVTITASFGVTALWVLPKLAAFQDANPNIDVRVAANNRVLDLKQEGIDLAIRYARKADVPSGAIELFGERVVPMASKAVAARAFRNPRALLNEVLLEYDEPQARPWLRWSEWLASAGMADAKPKAYLHCNQYNQLVQLAVDGHGVALGRVALVLPMLADGRLVAMPDGKVGESDYAYWLVEAVPDARPEVAMFREWLISEVRRTARQMENLQLTPSAGPPPAAEKNSRTRKTVSRRNAR
ncbi:MAG TPA: LysR substrate-binding domain-containing protein [Noviherbaspirillum sp.]|uniref:LysR substrate-binding domain-containing protein n=1 Tax=Noviherbaspirillum sp. TaxID=1926288 RepID=UPI002DDCDC89|nr:LysR substrate-binding domain-containing protein [Noviherbaspirillum sp.]HEV2610719.1 LysR substrate-binding domain-containing protein [Noviherbaspirillum sp.]